MTFFISDLIPPCEGSLMVWRGTVWKAAPRQKLTVSCPVKHCGESLNVTWCKLLSKNKCQWLNNANNVEITQNYSDVKELTSYLTFKCISTHDDGLYRCDVKGYNYKLISHTINISVSGRLFISPSVLTCICKMSNLTVNSIHSVTPHRHKPRG